MATLTVGSGQQYSTIAAAVAASNDGDVIQVQAGTYTNDFAEVTHKVTIEGVGGMANLVATEQIPNGKGILITDTDVTIDHLSFSGATVGDGNGAGIRYQGGALTITNSVFSNNQNGILANADPTGTISISHSEFASNGSGSGNTHGLYIGNIASLSIDDSYLHDANAGHEVKSRAASTTITKSRIDDGPNGSASYSIDLPNGGNAVINNNVIEQGPNSQNPLIVVYGEEGNLYANGSLTVNNDTILNDLNGSPSVMAVTNRTSVAATVRNLSTYGLTSSDILNGPGSVSGVVQLASEPALDTSSPLQANTNGGSTTGAGSSTPPPALKTAPVTTAPVTPTPAASPPATTPTTPTGSTPTTAAPPTGAPGTGLVLDISEDAWQGDAQYTISVDGTQVGGVRTASASHAAGHTEAVSVAASAGAHAIGVTFLNDAYGGSSSADRNLYVDAAQVGGQIVPGSTIALMANGTSTIGVTLPSAAASSVATAPAAGTLVLDISEDADAGDALYTVSVDGAQVGGIRTAAASHAAGQTQAVAIPVAAGAHTVAVSFLNDRYDGPNQDRNLYLDSATVNGQVVAGSKIALMATGTSDLGFVVPGSAGGSSIGSGTTGSGSTPTTTTPTTAPPATTPTTTTPPAAGTATATGASTTTNLVLHISEDAWQGDAQYTVSVDGTQVGGVRSASASHAAGQTASVIVPVTAGGHVVAVSFLNDAYGGSGSADRNLYVDGALIGTQPVPASQSSLLSNGTSSFGFTAPDASGATAADAAAPAGSLVLNMSEDAWQGDAQYTVSVDGVQVGGMRQASASHAAGQSQAVSIPVAFGGRTLAISFLNDRYDGPSEDRNLYVDSVSVAGHTLQASSIQLLSNGTDAFGVVIPTH